MYALEIQHIVIHITVKTSRVVRQFRGSVVAERDKKRKQKPLSPMLYRIADTTPEHWCVHNFKIGNMLK